MATLATTEFLSSLKTLYPLRSVSGTDAVIRNPWWIVTAVAFSASNRPEAVPVVFQHVLAELKQVQAEQKASAEAAHQEQLYLARRFRESVLKGGLLCGYSRVRLTRADGFDECALTSS